MANLQTANESEIQMLQETYNQAMTKAIAEQQKTVAEHDEKRRSVLQFISNIGFDLLPKSFTDQLINEVKAGLLSVKQFDLTPANLSLKDGHF